jgi:hypothetical protein
LEQLRFGGELLVGLQHEPLEPIDVTRLRRRLGPLQLPLL